MKRFIESNDRMQGTLFPEYLEDYVAEDNPVRVVDVFVEHLDLGKLGFYRAEPAITGRPSYHPSILLKLYIYGYLNRIQSSRRLEKETQRNVELMWLLGRLTPDFKTIARFRKENGKAIRKVCSQFVFLCRQLNLFSEAMVAIDGSKFKAVNNRDRNYTANKVARRREQIETSIGRYLSALETADLLEPDIAEAKTERLQEKITKLKQQMEQLDSIEIQLQETPDKQISLTDPDARSMATSGRGTGMVGYNVQVAVDTKHHLIVGHDRNQLTNMAKQARDAMAATELHVVADRGYFSSLEILKCQEAGITPTMPKPATSGAKADGRFGRDHFVYHPEQNEYSCPAGERLKWRYSRIEGNLTMHRYWSSACQQCALKAKCTPSKNRRVGRWEHEEVLEAMQKRLDQSPEACGYADRPLNILLAP
ncbi:transposase IS4 family protein [Methyloglobulus morosus KoM1]|uniref:Transposase IS4 family protein n=1 Tax=Methyloglobulus morosus KoM1 TaxID=1116472 RepID=V5AZZ7_9GAMM|nr:transposase IS4 family protein [Methyloglobulus morosus KoM1]